MPNHIDHPVHYTQGIECIDYIESHKMDYLEGNIIKYVTRYKFKGGVDDLRKAEWYLKALLKREALVKLETVVYPTSCSCDHPERGICVDNSWPSDCSAPLTLEDYAKEKHDEIIRETAEALRESEDAYCLGDFRRVDAYSKPWINE